MLGLSMVNAVSTQAVTSLSLATGLTTLEPPIPSAFGALQYDNTPNCAAAPVEVAYVVNRIIVQAGTSKAAEDAINVWLSQPAAPTSAVSRLRSANSLAARGGVAPKATLVDTITFPVPEDGDGRIESIYAFSLPGDKPLDVLALARFLVRKHGLQAGPDYVTMLAGHDFFKPDGLPQPTTELPVPRPPLTPAAPPRGTGARVWVFDSGLAPSTEPWLIPNVAPVAPVDVEIPDRLDPGTADDLWVGHGLAISSEIATLVPGAEIRDARVTRQGMSTDFTSAKRIVSTFNAASTSWPHLLVASFGTMACELDPKMPGDELLPVSLRAASELVDRLSPQRQGGMAIVAAAGNHGTPRPSYPAAFSDVIAVGALNASLDADGSPLTSPSRTAPLANFSARGPWIDVYAPGEEIVTLHVDGITFELADENGDVVDTVKIEGRARVQGTSFAAPFVAAQLAELMATHQISVAGALNRLQTSGVAPQVPCDGSAQQADLGPGVAVALVNLTAASDAPATEPPSTVC